MFSLMWHHNRLLPGWYLHDDANEWTIERLNDSFIHSGIDENQKPVSVLTHKRTLVDRCKIEQSLILAGRKRKERNYEYRANNLKTYLLENKSSMLIVCLIQIARLWLDSLPFSACLNVSVDLRAPVICIKEGKFHFHFSYIWYNRITFDFRHFLKPLARDSSVPVTMSFCLLLWGPSFVLAEINQKPPPRRHNTWFFLLYKCSCLT